MATVPPAVREEITANIMRGWRSGQFERLRSWRGGEDMLVDLRLTH
jgi:hypothetical protein